MASPRLTAHGPSSPDHGFPLWYEDDFAGTATRLALALDAADPNTPVVGELPIPGAPVVFPTNFPDEAFYSHAEVELPLGGTARPGRLRVVLALEAAFGGTGAVVDGQQLVFARVRVRISGGVPFADYVVTHPYGAVTLATDEDGRADSTEDVGGGPLDVDAVVRDGPVAPFLRWTSGAPAGYLGDGRSPHAVVGSPLGQNYVRVTGPQVTGAGGPQDPADPNALLTDLFVVQGRLATVHGVAVAGATYRRDAAGTTVDVLAGSIGGQSIELRGAGLPVTALRGGATPADEGRYVARATAGAPPAEVVVTNLTDAPATAVTAVPVDVVDVGRAEYDLDAGILTVEAASSDTDPGVTLSLAGFGVDLVAGTATVSTAAPPARVTVTSSAGGTGGRGVSCVGAAFPSVAVPTADAGADLEADAGTTVTLDGRRSAGAASFAWTPVSGLAAGDLVGAGTATPTFTMPAGPVVLRLTTTGSGGATAADEVTVGVRAARPADILLVEDAQFRTGRQEWRIRGTSDGPVPPALVVTLRLGAGAAATELGTAAVDPLGDWELRRVLGPADAALRPSVGAVVTATSTRGGSASTIVRLRS